MTPMTTIRATGGILAASLLIISVPGATGSTSSRTAPRDTPLHAMSAGTPVVLDDGVELTSNQANSLRLIANEEWAIANVRFNGAPEVGAIRLGEPGFSCITCEVLDGGREASPFADGKRAFVAKSEPGTSDIQFYVVSCLPSLVRCEERSVKAVTLPKDGIAQGVQNREPRVAPDGRHLAWTEVSATGGPVMVLGQLVERSDEYVIQKPYVLNPAYSFGKGAAQWVPGTRYYETGGGWLDGGRTLVYRSTSSSMNYDIYELDLATGQRTRVTHDLDYNEIYEGSPDSRFAMYASARGLDRMDVFTQLKRPAFLDTFTFPQLGRIALHNNRRCMNELWLMDRRGQRGQYAGQPLVLRDGWVIRGSDWFRDGRHALVTEQPFTPNAGTPAAGDEKVEMRVVTFQALKPVEPKRTVDLDTLNYGSWAIPYAQFRAPGDRALDARVVRGRDSGVAVVTYTGTFAAGTWSVTYRNFSDDGRSFLSGTEGITTPAAPLLATWRADLRSRGDRKGRMTGLLEIRAPAAFDGSVQTTVNGHTWRSVPTQATDCPGVHRPRLRVIDTADDGSRMRIRVGAHVPESEAPFPVAGVRVTVGSQRLRTGLRGWVTLPDTAGHRPVITLATGGFRPWTGRVST